MFSNITDAWTHDPVREISDKLSKGAFRDNTEQSKIFNFKNQPKEKTNPKDTLSLSDVNSISLLSENIVSNNHAYYSESDFKSNFAPVNFDKYSRKKHQQKRPNRNLVSSESVERGDRLSLGSIIPTGSRGDRVWNSDLVSESCTDSRCNYSSKHLKRCDRCHSKLKKMINTKVNEKFDEMILESKLKQLQNANLAPTVIQQPASLRDQPQNNTSSDSWKETLILIIGAIIAIFIIFLLVKSIASK